MPDFPSQDDLFRVGRDEILSKQTQLSREAVERDGSDANVLLAGAAAIGDDTIGTLAQVASGMFLDSASGTLLDRVVFDRYGLTRKPASPSYGSVYFKTTDPNPIAFDIPVGTVLQTADGLQYVTTASATFVLGGVACGPVAVRSALAGANQQAGKSTITSIVSQLANSPSDLTVTNTTATAGADDDEKDPAFRTRARAYYPSLRRGTKGALEFGALSVPGVRTAAAIEVVDSGGRPARYVYLAITDAFTAQLATLDQAVPTYEAQSQVFAQYVYQQLDDIRACGIYVQVYVAVVIMQPVQLRLSFAAGVDTERVALETRSVLVDYINSLKPGEDLLVSNMLAAVKPVQGLVYTGTEIASPSGDVIANPLQAIRTTLALVSAVSASTSQPLIASTNPDAFLGV